MSDNIALNSNETENVVVNLSNFETDIEKSLFDMSEIMVKISSLLEGELSGTILSKFSEFESQFPTINSNIKSYVNDFKNLIVSFNEQNIALNVQSVDMINEGGDLVNVNN